jgi:catechol 2,3-dioxygenase-like lactoylglutathione lyase family enzyme
MTKGTKTIHIALQYPDKEKAKIFFNSILGLSLHKTFSLSKSLSKEIFGIDEEVDVDVYRNEGACFEIFITNVQTKYNFEHTCIEIDNKDEFIKKCQRFGIEPIFVKKGDRTLLFIKDLSGYIYEIKEKK